MRKDSVSSFRSLGQNWSKLLAMTLIVALSFAFIFGISITPDKVKDSMDASLKRNRISDFNVKSLSQDGFSEEEKAALSEQEGCHVEYAFCLDSASLSASLSFYELLDGFGPTALKKQDLTQEQADYLIRLAKVLLPDQKNLLSFSPALMGEGNLRLFAFPDGKGDEVNVFNLVEGRMPIGESEIAIDALYRKENVGDVVSVFGKEYQIVGAVKNPLYYGRNGEPDLIEKEKLNAIYYYNGKFAKAPSLDSLLQDGLKNYIETNASALPESVRAQLEQSFSDIHYSFPESTDAFLFFPERDAYGLYSSGYESFLREKQESLKDSLPNAEILTAEQTYSRTLLMTSCQKMDAICYILPVFFLAVSGLVVSISMSRLIEEERTQIACLSSLGYTPFRIGQRFYFQALTSTLTGIALGLGAGYHFVFPLIFEAFNYILLLPSALSPLFHPSLTIVSACAMLALILILTFVQLKQTLRPLPAELLLPPSPIQGSKTKMEKAFFWKKLPFRFKSTFRNLVRFKKRVWMTVLSVGGSTAIVFAGFALLNIVSSLEAGEAGAVAKSIVPVAYFLILFAILLSALVLYNLMNMSITERSRELATLEVLGYHDKETVFYLYREIAFMTLLGILFGIPLGLGIMEIVVLYLNFGSLADIAWYSYLLPVGIMVFFAALVDLLLLPKIKKIDMISSLKSLD
mgnify:FL=1